MPFFNGGMKETTVLDKTYTTTEHKQINSDLDGIRTHDLCDEANWQLYL